MHRVGSYIDTETCYFNPPPAGEPDPFAYYDGMTPRVRVEKTAKKGMECWYTVMKWIQPPIGENYDIDFEEEHDTEKLIAHRRTMINQAERTLDYILSLDKMLKEAYQLKTVSKLGSKELGRPLKISESDRKKCEGALEGFQEQSETDDFAEFAMHNYFRMCNQCDEYFLFGALRNDESERGLQNFIEELYEGTARVHLKKPWRVLSLTEKRWALGSMALMTCGKLFGLQQARWNPLKPVTHLINELHSHGPLMVQGYFGRPHYEDKPHQLAEKIRGFTLFAWKPDAVRKNNMQHQFHPILIVGAKIDKEDSQVYFVDAMDQSDPTIVDSTPVYVMPFAKFQEEIASLEGIKIERKANSNEATNYAWYGAFKGYI